MSLDTDIVDDLQGAEETAGHLAHALRQALGHCDFSDLPGVLAAIAEWEDYCRPSCGFLEDGTCATGDTDVCGCPCQHDDTAAAPAEQVL